MKGRLGFGSRAASVDARSNHDRFMHRLFSRNPELEKAWAKSEEKRSLAQQVTSLRLQVGLSPEQVAEAAGLDVATVADVESAAGEMPTVETLKKIAQVIKAGFRYSYVGGKEWVDMWRADEEEAAVRSKSRMRVAG